MFERTTMDISKEKRRHILKYFFDKGQKVSPAVNHAKFWSHPFRSGNFIERPIVENNDEIMVIDDSNPLASTVSIA